MQPRRSNRIAGIDPLIQDILGFDNLIPIRVRLPPLIQVNEPLNLVEEIINDAPYIGDDNHDVLNRIDRLRMIVQGFYQAYRKTRGQLRDGNNRVLELQNLPIVQGLRSLELPVNRYLNNEQVAYESTAEDIINLVGELYRFAYHRDVSIERNRKIFYRNAYRLLTYIRANPSPLMDRVHEVFTYISHQFSHNITLNNNEAIVRNIPLVPFNYAGEQFDIERNDDPDYIINDNDDDDNNNQQQQDPEDIPIPIGLPGLVHVINHSNLSNAIKEGLLLLFDAYTRNFSLPDLVFFLRQLLSLNNPHINDLLVNFTMHPLDGNHMFSELMQERMRAVTLNEVYQRLLNKWMHAHNHGLVNEGSAAYLRPYHLNQPEMDDRALINVRAGHLIRNMIVQVSINSVIDRALGWTLESSVVNITQGISGQDKNIKIVFNCGPTSTDVKTQKEQPNCVFHCVNIALRNRLSIHMNTKTWCHRLRQENNINTNAYIQDTMFYSLYNKYKTLPYPTSIHTKEYWYNNNNYDNIAISPVLEPIILNTSTIITLNKKMVQYLHEHSLGLRDLFLANKGHLAYINHISIQNNKTITPLAFNENGTLKEFNATTPLVREDFVQHSRFMVYDFETYQDNKLLRDVICYIAQDTNNDGNDITKFKYEVFTTHKQEDGRYHTSARKLLDYLTLTNEKFVMVAHNAANFDHYFILQAMNDDELRDVFKEGFLRLGSSILQFSYKGHRFIDSCKFLTASLSNVCKAFLPNMPEAGKMSTAKFIPEEGSREIIMSTAQLCFYLNPPEPTPDAFDRFLKLSEQRLTHGNSFWNEYLKYCKQDVTALLCVWLKYNTTIKELLTTLVSKAARFNGKIDNKEVFKRGNLINCMTTGNHHMRILKALNASNPQWLSAVEACPSNFNMFSLVNVYKIGGMSISHKKGLFLKKLIAYDVKSLYPYSLMNALYPAGKPSFTTERSDISKPGLYKIYDLVFNILPINRRFKSPFGGDREYTYRPILEFDDATLKEIRSDFFLGADERTWCSKATSIKCTYVSSIGIQFLETYMGLRSYKFDSGVTWPSYVHGSSLFGNHIESSYSIKATQDEYKKTKDVRYNSALREAVKLGMNAITGKLGQSSLNSKNYTLKENIARSNEALGLHDSILSIEKDAQSFSSNKDLTTMLCFLYEHSKLTMFAYLLHLPNGFEDLIAIETDSIHTFQDKQIQFEKNINSSTVPRFLIHNDALVDVLDPKCCPFVNENRAKFIGPTSGMLETCGYTYINIFPDFAAGNNVSALGTLAVDKIGSIGMYLSKKKYALKTNEGWLIRLSGLKTTSMLHDGKVISILDIKTFIDICKRCFIYQDEVNLLDNLERNDIDIIKSMKERLKYTQKCSNLKKDASITYIYQEEVSKSVSPIYGFQVYSDSENIYNESTYDKFI